MNEGSPKNIFDLLDESDTASIDTICACDNCGYEINQNKEDASYCEECSSVYCKKCARRVLVHHVAEDYHICKFCIMNKD